MKWSEKPSVLEPVVTLWKSVGPRPDILLHPNVPKPLHTLAPRTVMGPLWWSEQKRKASEFYAQTCWACGVHRDVAPFHRWLECHELYDIEYARGRSFFRGCCALCHACHAYIHDGRLINMVEEGLVSEAFYFAVISRGEGVLRRAGHAQMKPKEPAVVAAWADWRLVIEGKQYGPAFTSEEQWVAHFKAVNEQAKAKAAGKSAALRLEQQQKERKQR